MPSAVLLERIQLALQPFRSLCLRLLPLLFFLSGHFVRDVVLNFVETSVFLFLLIVSVQGICFLLKFLEVTSDVGVSHSPPEVEQVFLGLLLVVKDLSLALRHPHVFFRIFRQIRFVDLSEVFAFKFSVRFPVVHAHLWEHQVVDISLPIGYTLLSNGSF